VDPQHAAGVADAFKRAVASRPHVLVCGRLASAEVVNLAMESAKERLVIATVEAPGAINGLVRLLEAGAQRNELAQRLSAVIGQRLPRRLCTDCREAYLPSFEALRRANMIQFGVERLFRVPSAMAQRCQHCRGMGYHGCVPLFEMVMLTARFRALISSGASEREMNLEARKEGMESLSEQGLKLMAAGITSADEMRRILQESVS
jgi:type II secretory ATPase GspE/PulE/Tfp pilus assembly ATPase PilB-like protein